jgi:microcystin-dependent protein
MTSDSFTTYNVNSPSLNAFSTTGDHQLTIAEMPAHTHNYSAYMPAQTLPNAFILSQYGQTQFVEAPTTSVGGNAAHSHPFSTKVLGITMWRRIS